MSSEKKRAKLEMDRQEYSQKLWLDDIELKTRQAKN